MFELNVDRLSFDEGLQIVQADVRLAIDGESVVEEPLCVDVGLPALLLSGLEDTSPYRWAPADEWSRMPFFVCGCGDPECRAYSFRVKHRNGEEAEWTLVEESEDGTYREQESYAVPLGECREQLIELGERFLAFVGPLDYRPYFADTVPVVQELVDRLKAAVR
ncbi:hypothetical protein [Paenibacillus flagellatus]|uniref:Uncharacterized protein n=1 Tax=Paenibacillus flagellatus TaxID=2211139 RepID=A0A2V5KJY9_9BACL|nr:hypothetical protein [Paenibacillus flagellatus]PYI50807.1 hypothetical protein DLM86_27440 [Paenibacillus flagellatus]